jgi:predicted RNA-binding protein with PIN domain
MKAERHGEITASDEELQKIFERTYGKIERDVPRPMCNEKPPEKYKSKNVQKGPVYLLIDGYNIIFAWDDLKKLAQESLELARVALIDRICNYQAILKNNVIIVFDAYKVKGNNREIEREHGISVVYTKEAETADTYIERVSHELAKNHRVRVATSDGQEQLIIFGNGAIRVTARGLLAEMNDVERSIRQLISY